MGRTCTAALTLLLLPALGARPASAQGAPTVPSLGAYAFEAVLEAGTLAVGIEPVDDLTYTGPANVHRVQDLAVATRYAPVLGGYPAVLSMTGQAMSSGVATQLPGAPGPNDAAQATAKTVVATLGNPFQSAKTQALDVVANGVVAYATETDIPPQGGGQPTATFEGAASVSGLTIGGSLIGKAVSLPASQPAPNTIVYQNASVTVTLNQQFRAEASACPSPAGPCFIVVAVDIRLIHAPVNGGSADDDIQIGVASAAEVPAAEASSR